MPVLRQRSPLANRQFKFSEAVSIPSFWPPSLRRALQTWGCRSAPYPLVRWFDGRCRLIDSLVWFSLFSVSMTVASPQFSAYSASVSNVKFRPSCEAVLSWFYFTFFLLLVPVLVPTLLSLCSQVRGGGRPDCSTLPNFHALYFDTRLS